MTVEEVERLLRKEWWLHHGHDGLYGDDGEMGCGACPADFKREPLDALYERVMLARAALASRAVRDREMRAVEMSDRAIVAGIAGNLLDGGDTAKGDALLNAVRCCGEFPECSHVLEWFDDAPQKMVRLEAFLRARLET